ncbi:MAG: hypothetical protein AMXMBFR64_11550 [Myxococcales bacterium]
MLPVCRVVAGHGTFRVRTTPRPCSQRRRASLCGEFHAVSGQVDPHGAAARLEREEPRGSRTAEGVEREPLWRAHGGDRRPAQVRGEGRRVRGSTRRVVAETVTYAMETDPTVAVHQA